MAQLVWFRSDLRVSDNPALSLAHDSGEPIHAVYIVSPAQWRSHHMGASKRDFLARNLQALERELAQLGIALTLLTCDWYVDVPQAITQLAQRLGVKRVLWHREYGWDERQRDLNTHSRLAKFNIASVSLEDRCLVLPESVLTGSGTPYKVFSAFKKTWMHQLCAGWQVPIRRIKGTSTSMAAVPVSLEDFYAPGDDLAALSNREISWPAGEQVASSRLTSFLQEAAFSYGERRDFPAQIGTSGLSPYLSAGVISARQCVAGWLNAADGDWHQPKLQVWLSELAWRDFYHYVMWHFPKVSRNLPFKDHTRALKWRQAPKDFEAWCEGRTGIPLVDAAMRQLNQTGWMHNRLRMVTAMFLTKNLLVDWRLGEAYFMEKLVDADLAANNGGWQWSASTGTDAVPYFRVFNPVTQSQRFDPEGEFIRHWLPELNALSNKEIHLPPSAKRGKYPAPMVDLKSSRVRAIEAFAAL